MREGNDRVMGGLKGRRQCQMGGTEKSMGEMTACDVQRGKKGMKLVLLC